jgi:hypothetical protein
VVSGETSREAIHEDPLEAIHEDPLFLLHPFAHLSILIFLIFAFHPAVRGRCGRTAIIPIELPTR